MWRPFPVGGVNFYPDATDGVLLLVARSSTGDPERLAAMLRDKGVTLEPASVKGLAEVVSSRGGAPSPPSVAAPSSESAAGVPADGTGGVMSFLSRLDGQPVAEPVSQPVSTVVPTAGSHVTVPGRGPARGVVSP